jgi:hypothetical protein
MPGALRPLPEHHLPLIPTRIVSASDCDRACREDKQLLTHGSHDFESYRKAWTSELVHLTLDRVAQRDSWSSKAQHLSPLSSITAVRRRS